MLIISLLFLTIATVSASDVMDISNNQEDISANLEIYGEDNQIVQEDSILLEQNDNNKISENNEIAEQAIESDNNKITSESDDVINDDQSKSTQSKALSASGSKKSTKITNSGSSIAKGNAYKVTLKDANGNKLSNKKITFTFGANKKTYNRTTDKNGVASLTINAAAGTYLLTYKFAGDSNYLASNGSVNLKVKDESKNVTKITGSGTSIVKGNAYKVTLKDANGNPLKDKTITFIFGKNNATYNKTTDENGVASLTINAAAGKSYPLTYQFAGDENYFASKGNVSLDVKINTTITGSGSSIVKGSTYKVSLKTIEGTPLANKVITFIFGTKNAKYNKTTNKNGVASLTINAAGAKIYPLTYKFAGDEYYLKSSESLDLTVQYTTKITGSGSKITKGNAYKVTLKDETGNPIANKTIRFVYSTNNSTYTRTTDENGLVNLTITSKEGREYPLTYAFDGDENYTSSSGSVNLTIQMTTAITGSGSTIIKGNAYKVTLKTTDGTPLANKVVTFIFGINNATYNKTTDKNGTASLTINAAAGKEYPLSFKFAGTDYYLASKGTVNLKVQSKTKLTGSGSSIIKGNSYQVTLKTTDGTPLANQKITFIFGKNNATYNKTTNKNGVASLTINAAAGKYSLKYKFEKTEYYLASSGTVNLTVKNPVKRGNQSQYKKGLNEVQSLTAAQLAEYLKTSGYDSVNSAIKTLANKLTSGKSGTWAKANALFNFVRDNISYSYYSDSRKGAATTLSSKSANCCDHSNLLVALCRAAGIPARFSHAQGCTFSSGLVAGHVWAQIYIDGVWITGDATSSRNSLGNIHNWNTNSFYSLKQYTHLPF